MWHGHTGIQWRQVFFMKKWRYVKEDVIIREVLKEVIQAEPQIFFLHIPQSVFSSDCHHMQPKYTTMPVIYAVFLSNHLWRRGSEANISGVTGWSIWLYSGFRVILAAFGLLECKRHYQTLLITFLPITKIPNFFVEKARWLSSHLLLIGYWNRSLLPRRYELNAHIAYVV